MVYDKDLDRALDGLEFRPSCSLNAVKTETPPSIEEVVSVNETADRESSEVKLRQML